MNEQTVDNIALVSRFLELVGEAEAGHTVNAETVNFSAVKSLLSPDFVIVNPIFHPKFGLFRGVSVAEDGALNGRDALQADLEATAAHFSFGVKDYILADACELVVFRGTIIVTGRSSGKTIETPFAELFYIECGLIKRIEPFLNVSALKSIL